MDLRPGQLEKRADEVQPKKGFQRFAPMLSYVKKPAKVIGKALAGATIFSAIAIGGANLGTYFDYTYNNYDYGKFENKTTLDIKGQQPSNPRVKQALEAATLKLVGAKAPEEASLKLEIIDKPDGKTVLEGDYVMVWSTNKGLEHRDEEELKMTWVYSESQDRFIPEKAETRYHYKWVEMPLGGLVEQPVVVIQNPAHTPGIPGASPRYIQGSPAVVDIFTLFSAEKWAGSCLSTGLPQEFHSMQVNFSVTMR